jgi:hypothetical protein
LVADEKGKGNKMNIKFPFTPELKPFQDADDAWSDELFRVFGWQACQARYQDRGKGEAGSELRRLYELKEAARRAWYASAYR